MSKPFKVLIVALLVANSIGVIICLKKINAVYNGTAPTRTPMWYIWEKTH